MIRVMIIVMKMNKNAIGLRIQQEKANIIAMHNKGAILQDIANEYNVAVSTIHMHLRNWGIPVKRKAYKRKVKGVSKYKRRFSKEFLANRTSNTATNNNSKRFKHYGREDTKSEFDRIHNITKQKVIVI